ARHRHGHRDAHRAATRLPDGHLLGPSARPPAPALGAAPPPPPPPPPPHRQLWERLALTPDFTVLKHRLAEVKASFAAAAYYHIGDTDGDAHFADLAGFRFFRADAISFRTWGPELFPDDASTRKGPPR